MGKVTLTNNYNLPAPLVDAVAVDTHPVAGGISVTEMWKPPQIRQLKRLHDIEEDALDRIWALLGTAAHVIVERANIQGSQLRYAMETLSIAQQLKEQQAESADKIKAGLQRIMDGLMWMIGLLKKEFGDPRYLSEHTMCVTIDGMDLYGTPDLLDQVAAFLYDVKVTSVWSAVFADSRKPWIAQLNTYAFMFREEGHEVNEAGVIAIFRDWQSNKVFGNRDYPRKQAGIVPIQLFPNDAILKRIRQRIALHSRVDSGQLAIPECTPEEKWEKATDYAVKKKKNKKASKVLASLDLAESWINDKDPSGKEGYHIEVRPGEKLMCAKYCPVRDVCPQRIREAKADKEVNQ